MSTQCNSAGHDSVDPPHDNVTLVQGERWIDPLRARIHDEEGGTYGLWKHAEKRRNKEKAIRGCGRDFGSLDPHHTSWVNVKPQRRARRSRRGHRFLLIVAFRGVLSKQTFMIASAASFPRSIGKNRNTNHVNTFLRARDLVVQLRKASNLRCVVSL